MKTPLLSARDTKSGSGVAVTPRGEAAGRAGGPVIAEEVDEEVFYRVNAAYSPLDQHHLLFAVQTNHKKNTDITRAMMREAHLL